MNILLTIIGAVIGGAIAYAPAHIMIWLSNNAKGKTANISKALGSLYLIILWLPLTILLGAFFINRLNNG